MRFSLVLVDPDRVVAGLRSGSRESIGPALGARPEKLLGYGGLLASLEVRESLNGLRLPGIQDETEALSLEPVAAVLRRLPSFGEF